MDGSVGVVAIGRVQIAIAVEIVVGRRGIAVVVFAVVGDLGRAWMHGWIVIVAVALRDRVAVAVGVGGLRCGARDVDFGARRLRLARQHQDRDRVLAGKQ